MWFFSSANVGSSAWHCPRPGICSKVAEKATDDRLQLHFKELDQRIRATRAYRAYRGSALYDEVRRRAKALKRTLNLPRYLGSAYQCPVCGTGLRAFKPLWKSYWREFERFRPLHPPSAMETFNVA